MRWPHPWLLNLINDLLDAASMKRVRIPCFACRCREERGAHFAHVFLCSYCCLTGHVVATLTLPRFFLAFDTSRNMSQFPLLCLLQGKLTIKQEKVNLFNVAQDVIELCQPLVCACVSVPVAVGRGNLNGSGRVHVCAGGDQCG